MPRTFLPGRSVRIISQASTEPRGTEISVERGVIVSNAVTMTKEKPPRKKLTARRIKNLILNVLKNPFNMVVLVSLIVLFCHGG